MLTQGGSTRNIGGSALTGSGQWVRWRDRLAGLLRRDADALLAQALQALRTIRAYQGPIESLSRACREPAESVSRDIRRLIASPTTASLEPESSRRPERRCTCCEQLRMLAGPPQPATVAAAPSRALGVHGAGRGIAALLQRTQSGTGRSLTPARASRRPCTPCAKGGVQCASWTIDGRIPCACPAPQPRSTACRFRASGGSGDPGQQLRAAAVGVGELGAKAR